jgi:hypothetical protein
LSAKDSHDDDDDDDDDDENVMSYNFPMKHAVHRCLTNTILGAKSYLVPELK